MSHYTSSYNVFKVESKTTVEIPLRIELPFCYAGGWEKDQRSTKSEQNQKKKSA